MKTNQPLTSTNNANKSTINKHEQCTFEKYVQYKIFENNKNVSFSSSGTLSKRSSSCETCTSEVLETTQRTMLVWCSSNSLTVSFVCFSWLDLACPVMLNGLYSVVVIFQRATQGTQFMKEIFDINITLSLNSQCHILRESSFLFLRYILCTLLSLISTWCFPFLYTYIQFCSTYV